LLNVKRPSSVWNIGRREVIAAILGVLLYGLLSHATLIILLSSNTVDVFLPALLIPLLFGAIYGPWVGLVVGGFGFLLGDYVASTWLSNLVWDNGYLFAGDFFGSSLVNFRDLVGWNGIPGYMVNALIGMVAGLTAIGPRRFNNLYLLAAIGMIAAIVTIAAIAIAVYSAVPIYQSPYYTLSEATIAFFDTALPNLLIALVLLPLLLWVYDRAVLRRKKFSCKMHD
jgi:energy-coupling factor transport system substrate-specific component